MAHIGMRPHGQGTPPRPTAREVRRTLPENNSEAAMIEFDLDASDGAARAGRLRTARGVVETPVFMPVATQSSAQKRMTGTPFAFWVILSAMVELLIASHSTTFVGWC